MTDGCETWNWLCQLWWRSGYSSETQDIAALVTFDKQCNLEVETLTPRDMFASKAAQERAMDYSCDLKHFCTYRHDYFYEFSADSCHLRFLLLTDL